MTHPFLNLLFLDTFTHERGEDINIDLVKFSGHPVVVREIRIVPNNTCVPVEPGAYSQGYTQPTAFSLEIFVNNLSRTAACTFEKLCSFDYRSEKDIRIVPQQPIATDGLLIRGPYHVITLAVFGDPAPEEPPPSLPYPVSQPSSAAVVRTPVPISPTQPTQQRPLIMPHILPQTPAPQQPIPVQQAGAGSWSHNMMDMPLGVAHFNPLVPPPLPLSQTSPFAGGPPPSQPPQPPVPPPMPPPAMTSPPQPIPTLAASRSSSASMAAVFAAAASAVASFDVSRPPPICGGQPAAASAATAAASPSKDNNIAAVLAARRQSPAAPRQKTSSSSHHRRRAGHGVKRSAAASAATVFEGKPIETIGTVKPVVGTPLVSTSFDIALNLGDTLPLEEGEYANSDDDLNFETISDDEFELDEAAGDIDDAELQEDLLKDTRFNVHRFEMSPLIHFKSPHLSEFEIEKTDAPLKYLDEEIPEFVKYFVTALDDFSSVRNDKWVIALECILPNLVKSVVYVQEKLSNKDPFPTLIQWTLDGLNVDLSLKQEPVAFVIRHLKVGFKLASALATFESSVAEQLMNLHLQHRLIDLINVDHMSMPLKLQIVKALDCSLFFPVGYTCFVNQIYNVGNQPLTPYQRLSELLQEKLSTRLMVALKLLLKKAHFYRLLSAFSSRVQSITKDVDPLTSGCDQRTSSNTSEAALEEDEVNEITDSLHEILLNYKNAKTFLSSPPYSLPAKVVFEATPPSGDPYPSLFLYFTKETFLESLLLLLTCQRSNQESRIVTSVCQMLNEILSTSPGLLFLATQQEVTRELLRFCLQNNDDGHDDETVLLQHVGNDLAYHLQALRLIDELMHYHNSGVVQLEVDNPGVLVTLQSFYVLTFDHSNENRGRRSVVRVLSFDNNLNAILPFVELTDDEEWDNKIKKSACAGYATELLLLVLRLSDSVELLKNFGDKLLAINCEDAGSKIADVKQWTDILRKLPSFSYDSVDYLCEKVKSFLQQDTFIPKIPKGLITALRILKYIVVPPDTDTNSAEHVEELKHKYALMQMISLDTLSTLIQIVEQLAESHMINWQQGISLNSHHGTLFYACILPTLSLIKTTVSFLIHCRGAEFQDITAVGPLVKLYAVCCSMLPTSGVVPEATLVQKDIIGTLLAYTQPNVLDKANDLKDDSYELVSKSLWTKAVGEILKFGTESPFIFVSGLSILSELLPLPLPVQSKEPLTVTEISAIESKRRLLSAHLMPLAPQLQQIIKDLTPTTHTNLQQCLRRVCVQLSDLSSPIAYVVAKAVLNVVLENAEIVETTAATPVVGSQTSTPSISGERDGASGLIPGVLEIQPPVVVQRRLRLPASGGLAFSLNLLSYMSSHGPFKIVMMDLLRSKNEPLSVQDTYSSLLGYFLEIFNFVSHERCHQVCQEYIVSILQSLCDEDIGLVLSEKTVTYEQIFSSVIEPVQLRSICEALLKHIGCKEQSYATVLPSLRIFVMLCEHDYGLYNIKCAMEVERKAFLSMFERLLLEFSGHSSDCLSSLSTFVELMKLLQSPLPLDESKADVRKSLIGVDFIREILEWKYGERSNDDHPLKKLCLHLETSAKEDDALTSLFSNVKKLVDVLADPSVAESEEFVQPTLPPTADVRAQFNQRQVWTLINDDDDDRLTAHYWFPVYTLETEDGDVEKVECDLEAIRLQYFPQFDVGEELKRKFSSKRLEDTMEASRRNKPNQRNKTFKFQEFQRVQNFKDFIDTSGGPKGKFIAPLRGRAPIRGGYHQPRQNRPNDPFRSRPPNTSRPPSMHVDDFIIAQSQSTPSSADVDKQLAPGPSSKKDSSTSRSRDRLQQKSTGRPRMSSPPPPVRSHPYTRPMMTSARSFDKGHTKRYTAFYDRMMVRSGRKSRIKVRSSGHRSPPRRKSPK